MRLERLPDPRPGSPQMAAGLPGSAGARVTGQGVKIKMPLRGSVLTGRRQPFAGVSGLGREGGRIISRGFFAEPNAVVIEVDTKREHEFGATCRSRFGKERSGVCVSRFQPRR